MEGKKILTIDVRKTIELYKYRRATGVSKNKKRDIYVFFPKRL